MFDVIELVKCQCCRRKASDFGSQDWRPEMIEEKVLLCRDCQLMYQLNWRLERGHNELDVKLFLQEVRDGIWTSSLNSDYRELAEDARRRYTAEHLG